MSDWCGGEQYAKNLVRSAATRSTWKKIMKAIPILLVLVILFLPSQAQESDQSKIQQSLYYRALVAALAARAQDTKYAAGNDPLYQVIIAKDDQLNAGFPTRIGNIQIEYLTSDDLRARHRSLKRTIPVFVMRPMVNEGDRLVLDFTRYWFGATRRTNTFSLEGGYRVVFGYDCSQKTFVVESTKLWGI